MSAQSVWNCICRYNYDAAKKLVKQGYSSRTAVRMLASYADRDKYHGHASGKGGDGEHVGAATLRTNAIFFLEQRANLIDSLGTETKNDKQKESENRKHEEELMALLADFSNLGEAQDALTLADPNWRNIRGLQGEITRRKEEKKNKNQSQKK